jgi:ADP-ribose pyrophosphatase YjhB (NUDIX family)
MTTELQIHEIQAKILRLMLFIPAARFSQLNVDKIPNDHFSFHLKKLLEEGLIIKRENEKYELTPKGKEFANRMDTDTAKIERQAKIGVAVIAVRKKRKQIWYLVQKRLKHPYYGYWGAVTGKVRWGDTAGETAIRELAEETGLKASTAKLVGIEHKQDYDPSGKILEDKFFLIFRVDKFSGKLRQNFEGGENYWLTKKEIGKLPEVFPDVGIILKIIGNKYVKFMEEKYKVEKY